MMNKVKITAVRKTEYPDLMAKFENPILHTCDVFLGQSWISADGKRPEGMCESAWGSMREFVKALARGEGNFFDGWMKDPMSAMISCNDGFRPVSFYLEVIDCPKVDEIRQHNVEARENLRKNCSMNGDIFLETPRLRFRPWRNSDAEALYKYARDPEVGPRAGWQPHRNVEESLSIIRDVFSNGHTWALELKETGEPVGCMGYYAFGESNIDIGEDDAELGYWIARPYWNRGLCTEALRAMVAWCFSVKGFQVLWSDFFVDNPASGRVMEKCGFRDTGEVNWCSHLYRGDERPVKVMRLDYALD